ncbi:MAG: DUF2914 domain-containing protein [Chitinivibrionales bacterium]|nr:DUF2914 domain-containing protein [Chitinivibrionales bacterium]
MLEDHPFVLKGKELFKRINPYIPATCFLGGFTWDNFTLKRIDNKLDILIFGLYLLLAGVVITLIGRKVTFKFSNFLPWGVQFFFGGLFSSFFVYYVKSASSLPTLLFMLLLLTMLVGNEFLEKKYGNITLASIFYGIASFMYFNAIIPVLLRHMSILTFLLAMGISAGLVYLIKRISKSESVKMLPLGGIYSALLIFYFANAIPPVPLAKKDMGIYRGIGRSNGAYVCSMRKPAWYKPWQDSEENFLYASGDRVYCFSSIFAPTKLKKKIYHQWYYKGPDDRKYARRDRIGYRMEGGRDGGYRGYTCKSNVQFGKWKVVLQTEDNKTLGIARFKVSERDTSQELKLKTVKY